MSVRTFFFTLLAIVAGYTSLGQTTTKNYVRSVVSRKASSSSMKNEGTTGNTKQSVEYFDGLGRPIQNIIRWGSSEGNDLITPYKYDQYDRQTTQYLPYRKNQVNAVFDENDLSNQGSFYSGGIEGKESTLYPFSEIQYEVSPLQRIQEQGSPGADWQIGNHTIVYDYEVNADNEVIKWGNENLNSLTGTFYDAGELYKNIIKDEDSNEVATFTNKSGQTILKRSKVNSADWADTYYIYDDIGNLRVVLPPESIKHLNEDIDDTNISNHTLLTTNYTIKQSDTNTKFAYMAGTTVTIPPNITLADGFELKGINSTISNSQLDDYAFQYKYDGRNRMISKKVPGSEPVYMVYDKWNRLVLTQDGNQRQNNEWIFTKYDELNRPIITGICNDSRSASDIQNALHAISYNNRSESFSGSGTTKYSNTAFPSSNIDKYLTITYFDNYDFIGGENYTDHGFSNSVYHINPVPEFNVKGLLTGSSIHNGDDLDPEFLQTVTYYDNKYRPIQIVMDNHLGNTDIISNQYDFAGNIRRSHLSHGGRDNITILREYDYDHMDRLLTVSHKIDNEPAVIILSNEYNEIGELTTKKLHSEDDGQTYEQLVDYDYNIRGWLTAINNSELEKQRTIFDPNPPRDLFGMELYYNTNSGITGHENRYNGNISAIRWSNYDNNGDGIQRRAYEFDYDGLNRLTDANHVKETNTGTSEYDVNIPNYDLNGNITGLTRKSENGASIDDLSYIYNGNQLLKVTDASNNAKGFDNGSSGSNIDYTYDANGNMKSDANKGITNINYNHLNLPTRVTFDIQNYIEYVYDANGTKLQQKVFEDGSLEKTTDYVGDFIYEKGFLKLIQHEEGRIAIDYAWNIHPTYIDRMDYQYHLKDHLGNVRVTFGTTPEEYVSIADMEPLFPGKPSGGFNNGIPEYALPGEAHEGEYVSRNYNTENNGVDLNIMLSIDKGDKINASAYAWYNDNSSSFTHALGSVANYLFNYTTGGVISEGVSYNQSSFDQAFTDGSGLGGKSNSSTAPMAYINYIFFDSDMQYVTSGFKAITTASKNNSSRVELDAFIADQDGYILLYLSNETMGSMMNVSWDYFKVNQIKTNVVSTQDYYPFGLQFNEYKRTASIKNFMNTFQDQEYEEETGWVKFKWRNHQPDIGRFFNVDPLAEDYYYNSPYAFSENKVVAHIELEGLESYPVNSPYGTITVVRRDMEKSGATKQELKEFDQGVNEAGSLAAESLVEEIPFVGEGKMLLDGDIGGALLSAIPGFSVFKNGRRVFKKLDDIPLPKKGKGDVPPSQRDPKRAFSKKEKSDQLEAQDGKCAGCGENKTVDEVDGHHVERHADGGKTDRTNIVDLCKDCHKEIHKKKE
ncbi:MAG: DUF6443 domain-containing protein [Bacteroidota bacterium]